MTTDAGLMFKINDQALIADYITEALGVLKIDNTEEDAFHMLGGAIADAVAYCAHRWFTRHLVGARRAAEAGVVQKHATAPAPSNGLPRPDFLAQIAA